MNAQVRSRGIAGLGFIVLASTLMLLFSALRHSEADMVRTLHRDGVCEGVEVYFSPKRGTALILCGIPATTDDWGGLIYRVSENYGHTIIEPYEVTVFVGTRHYWDNVLARDEYLPIALFPDIARVVRGL